MGYFTDCGLLVLLSFLRLFYRLPDAGFLIAFLCTVILVCSTYALGKKLSIPVVSGSDTHQAVQYGCVTTVFERECNTIPALYEEMREGRYAIRLADTAPFQVRTACLLKRSLKEIHALGGDYVSILTQGAAV